MKYYTNPPHRVPAQTKLSRLPGGNAWQCGRLQTLLTACGLGFNRFLEMYRSLHIHQTATSRTKTLKCAGTVPKILFQLRKGHYS